MKRYILFLFSLVFLAACTREEPQGGKTYDSVIEPDFTINVEGDVIEKSYVSFTNQSKVEGTEIDVCFWHFGFTGEGNWQDEYDPEPVLYMSPGEYTVSLTIIGKDGHKVSKTKPLTILRANVLPKADFTYDVEDKTITLTNASVDEDGSIVSVEWTVHDGATEYKSTEGSLEYTFAGGGKKIVTLTVVDDRGESATVSKIIYVRAPVNEFTVNWEIKVAGSGASAKDNVVTVAENEAKLYFNTSEGKLLAITDNFVDASVSTAVDTGNSDVGDSYMSYPAYSDGRIYWCGEGVMYAVDASTDQQIWKNDKCYTNGSAIHKMTPCVTPGGVIISGADKFGPEGNHITAFVKDGSKTMSKGSSRGASFGPIVMLKNGTGLANTNRITHGWIRPDWEKYTLTVGKFFDSTTKKTNLAHPSIDANGQVYLMVPTLGLIRYDMSTSNEFTAAISDAKYRIWTCDKVKDKDISLGGTSLSADGNLLYMANAMILYVISTKDGSILHEVALPGNSISVPAVDNTGAVHVLCDEGSYVIMGTDYEIRETHKLADEFSGSVTISNSGVLYFAGKKADGWYVFSVSLPGVSGPADSAWAQYGQDSGHTNYQK